MAESKAQIHLRVPEETKRRFEEFFRVHPPGNGQDRISVLLDFATTHPDLQSEARPRVLRSVVNCDWPTTSAKRPRLSSNESTAAPAIGDDHTDEEGVDSEAESSLGSDEEGDSEEEDLAPMETLLPNGKTVLQAPRLLSKSKCNFFMRVNLCRFDSTDTLQALAHTAYGLTSNSMLYTHPPAFYPNEHTLHSCARCIFIAHSLARFTLTLHFTEQVYAHPPAL